MINGLGILNRHSSWNSSTYEISITLMFSRFLRKISMVCEYVIVRISSILLLQKNHWSTPSALFSFQCQKNPQARMQISFFYGLGFPLGPSTINRNSNISKISSATSLYMINRVPIAISIIKANKVRPAKHPIMYLLSKQAAQHPRRGRITTKIPMKITKQEIANKSTYSLTVHTVFDNWSL